MSDDDDDDGHFLAQSRWFDSVAESPVFSTCLQHSPGAWGHSHSLVTRQYLIVQSHSPILSTACSVV